MSLRNTIKRRHFKNSLVSAIDAKYGLNIKREADSLSSPTFEDMLDMLYDRLTIANVAEPFAVGLQILEEMLAARGLSPADLRRSAEATSKNGK